MALTFGLIAGLPLCTCCTKVYPSAPTMHLSWMPSGGRGGEGGGGGGVMDGYRNGGRGLVQSTKGPFFGLNPKLEPKITGSR